MLGYLVDFFAITCILVGAYILHRVPTLEIEGRGIVHRIRMDWYSTLKQAELARKKTTRLLYDERVERAFKNAGYPLKINSIRWNAIRLLIVSAYLLLVLLVALLKEPFYWRFIWLAIPLYFLLDAREHFPLNWLLENFQAEQIRKKNRECFLFYSMIQNELMSSDTPLNMYAILNRLMPYFDLIRPAIAKAMLKWKEGPDVALDAFAQEVGTEEAQDLADILKGIDFYNPKEAVEVLKSRYETFLTIRHEHYRRKIRKQGTAGFSINLLPALMILLDCIFVLYLQIQDLLRVLNNF